MASSSGAAADSMTSFQGDEVFPLSSELYCDVVLSKTHLSPRYQMGLSNSLSSKLPSVEVPTVLNYRGNSWDLIYKGQSKGYKWFDCGGWGNFAHDNCLKVGDACIFEVMECSNEKIIFRVQILRGDIPSKFHEKVTGEFADVPIVVD